MEHERFEGERTLMRIHIGESDRWHGSPLYEALIKLFRHEGFSGVTVLTRCGRVWLHEPPSHRQGSASFPGSSYCSGSD